MRARGGGSDRSGLADAGSTLSLVALSLVAATGFARLFDSGAWVLPVLASLATGHGVSWLARRLRLPSWIAVASSIVAVALVTCWTCLGGTTIFGVPSLHTFHVLAGAFSRVPYDMRTMAAPAPVTTGFLLMATLGMGLQAVFTDWAAMRASALWEPLVPTFAVLVLTGGLGIPSGRIVEAVCWTAAALSFVFFMNATRSLALHLPGTARRSAMTVLAAGGGTLAVVALSVGALIGPVLPGAGASPVVQWHNNGAGSSGARTTISPLVEIRSQLLKPSKDVVFSVRSSTASYWRLTSLDHFNGNVWSADQTTQPIPSYSRNPQGAAGSKLLEQTFHIASLGNLWLPAAYQPVSVSGPSYVAYDPASSSIIDPRGAKAGLTYKVWSELPALKPNELSTATVDTSDPALEPYLELPSSVPSSVISLAKRIVAGARTPYAKALALQNYFRQNFTYSLSVPASSSDDAMVAFLRARKGYCQQFAGTFAVMARAVGLPSRVAVGFTFGQKQGNTYVVRALDAHAWPEVLMGRFGWVPFEPTPGRGAPGESAYAGVQPAQAALPGGSAAVRPGATKTSNLPTTGSSISPSELRNALGLGQPGASGKLQTLGGPKSSKRGGVHLGRILVPLGWSLLGAAATTIVASFALAAWRRRRRLTESKDAGGAALEAWTHATEALAINGLCWGASETPERFSIRISDRLDPSTAGALERLASCVTTSAYSQGGASREDVASARDDAETVHSSALRHAALARRARYLVDPRSPLLVERRSTHLGPLSHSFGGGRNVVEHVRRLRSSSLRTGV